MDSRSMGVKKLSPEVRAWLAERAGEFREMVYGKEGCPEWGTSFAQIEEDANEVGHELIRLMMEQTAEQQAASLPAEALTTETGEKAQGAGRRRRSIETESGEVSWNEPEAYLPKTRKAFFPSVEGAGGEG